MKNTTERRACVEYSFEIDNYATNAFGLIRLGFGDVLFGLCREKLETNDSDIAHDLNVTFEDLLFNPDE